MKVFSLRSGTRQNRPFLPFLFNTVWTSLPLQSEKKMPRRLITSDLVMEKYLEYQQVPTSDPPRYEFLWGPRAHAEVSKMKLLEFLAKIHGTNPKSFPSQYEEALRDEEERARARIEATAGTSAMASASSGFSHPY